MRALPLSLLVVATLAHASAANPATDWSALVARVLPSAVSVEIYLDPDAASPIYSIPGVHRTWMTDIFDRIAKLETEPLTAMKATPNGGGAGFCLGKDGLILTVGHLLSHGKPKRIVVELANHVRVDADVVAADISADVAVLRTKMPVACPPVIAADMSSVAVGQPVLVVGSPSGYSESVSAGIISGLREDAQILPRSRWVQFDAPIHYGNSGGPVFNADGRVVGMVSYGSGGSAQFAVPIDRALDVANRLLRCSAHSNHDTHDQANGGGNGQ